MPLVRLAMKKITLIVITGFFYSSAFALEIVVTVKPLHSLVQSILGDSAEATLLLDNSASPHDVQLKPSAIRALSKADAVIMIDQSFEGFMHRIIKSATTALTIIQLSQYDELKRLKPRNHQHEGHSQDSHAVFDPHFWLSPDNAISIVKIVTRRLNEIDETNSSLYQANLEKTIHRLTLLDEKLRMQLNRFEDLAYITQHDAYQYFEVHYNLNFIKSIALDSSIPPSVKLALTIQKDIKNHNVRCIYGEPQFSQRLVNTIAKNAGIKSGILDPIGIDLSPGADLYFELMENLSNNFTQCLAHRT